MTALALLSEALRTRRNFGIGLIRQTLQATYLRFGASRLDPWEYYFFRVFLDRYPLDEKRRFIGWRREIALDRMLNTGPARELANDKLRFAEFMAARGAPLPRIEAVYGAGGRGAPGAALLNDAAELARFLAASDAYPMFVKPVRGAHGRQACVLRQAPADGGVAATSRAQHGEHGYLFQELLRTHPAIGAACGDRLSSVRLVVLGDTGDPRILSAVWRGPTGTNVTDNFGVGFPGNLIAAVDLRTGAIAGVTQGRGWRISAVERHPDTDRDLRHLRVPGWPTLRQLCLDCAANFPDLRLQHWDVALTDRGPVVLELNVNGGLRTHQIVAAGPAALRPLSMVGDCKLPGRPAR